MSLTWPLGQALDAVYNRLSNVTDGLNPRLAAACSQYGTPTGLAFNFADGSNNFFDSQFDVVDLYNMDGTELPALCMYEEATANANIVMSDMMSGPVVACMDVHLAWVNPDSFSFGKMRKAVHDAMVQTFNVIGSAAQVDFQTQNCMYSGRIRYGKPSKVIWVDQQGAFLQTMPFVIQFDVFAQ